MTHRHRATRGIMLVWVVVALATIGALVTAVAHLAVEVHRIRQLERTRQTARLVLESAALYAGAHAADWRSTWPTEPVSLDVSRLLGPDMTGSALLTLTRSGAEVLCRVDVVVDQRQYRAVEQRDIRWPG